MLNHIVLMGRLTRDPELRRTGSGVAVASFTLAVDRDYKSQSGEKETDFIDVVAWRSSAEFVSKYFTKGRMAVVEGRLQIRDWTDKDGGKRRSAQVVADNVYFGDSKRTVSDSDTPAAGERCPLLSFAAGLLRGTRAPASRSAGNLHGRGNSGNAAGRKRFRNSRGDMPLSRRKKREK